MNEIESVEIPREFIFRQRNINVDINDLCKASGGESLKKVIHRLTSLLNEIYLSEPEVFNEDVLGPPEEMYFAAYQKGIIPGSHWVIDSPENPKFYKNGIIQGAREEMLNKAQHEKIAWFIKNTEPMAKAREIIKLYKAIQRKAEDNGIDMNPANVLFDYTLGNSSLKQFKQYDQFNEVRLLENANIDIELWNIYRANEKAQKFFGKKNILATDYFLSQEIMSELLKTQEHTGRSVDFGTKLFYFPSADTAPMAVLNSYRESGHSGERPFLSIHYKSEESELFKFIMKLDEQQLKIIEQQHIPGLYEIITAVKASPATFNSEFIKNPDIAKFIEALKNDEEFLDYAQEQSFPEVKEYKISTGQVKNKETGEWEETRINYYPNENYCFIGMAYLKEILPEIKLGDQVISIKQGDVLFNKIKRALVKNALQEEYIGPNPYEEKAEFMTYIGASEKYYFCPEEKIVYFLDKLGYPRQLFNKPDVYNPLYDQIQRDLVKMSEHYLKDGDSDRQFYLMGLLKKLAPDLNGIYDHLSKILTGNKDYRIQKETIDCLIARAEKYDKKALEIILTCYDQAPNVRNDIKQKAPEFVNLLVHGEYKFNQDEKEMFEKLIGNVINYSNEDVTRTINFFIQIKEAGYYLHCSKEDVEDYIALSRNPAMVLFIPELLKDDFSLPYKKLLLQQIYEKRSLILPVAKKLKEYGISFDLGQNFTQIIDVAENDLLSLLAEYNNKGNSRIFVFIFQHAKELGIVPQEKRKDYLDIFLKIDESPSQEIQRLKDQLLKGLLETDNPIGSYKKINDIFIKNNLPTAGKVFKVFAVLHKPEEIKKKLSHGSPVLTQTKSQRRLYDIFYRDLLKIHIASGNRSLRQYCEILKEGEKILGVADEKGTDNLTYAERKKLKYFFDKIGTLFMNSALGRNFEAGELPDQKALNEQYQNLRQSLGCKQGQKITDRISQMFLKPVGLNSLDEVLSQMREVKKTANARGVEYASQAGEGALKIQAGDLLKVVDANYIENILQNGSVAKEFLGPVASSDYTPFDTDVTRLQKEVAEQGFSAAVSQSKAIQGELLFCVKDRGQFELTEREKSAKYNPQKLELFVTGGGDHYGVRTGFPTTEIDFMIAEDSLLQNKRNFNKICYEIAQNGWYIPIADTNGKIIFTPAIYDEYRKIFDGLERFDGNKFEFIPADENQPYYRQIQEIIENKRKDEKNIRYLSDTIKETLREVLENLGLAFKDEFSTSIIGAEFLNIGSTGRSTKGLSPKGDFIKI